MDTGPSPNEDETDLDNLSTDIHRELTRTNTDLTSATQAVHRHTITELREALGELVTEIDRIPSSVPPPQTTLQLQNRADVEEAWQNYLQYFLNPDANHGLGTDALTRFLQHLDSLAADPLPTRVSGDIKVEAEVESPNGNRPDIVIHEPGEFFVCCELKLYASEGPNQTKRYVTDEYIGRTVKREFPDHGHHYVYIRRPGHTTSYADEFFDITWRDVRNSLEPLITNGQGRYPTRTTAQLADFLDTIQQDMTQDEHIKTAQEKMELYFNHIDAIREAEDGLETVYEYELQHWRRRFIENYLPDNWSEEWHTNPDRNGQIYHTTWRQNDGLALTNDTVRMHFVHLIRDEESFRDGKLTFQLRWPGDSQYKDRFTDLFMSDEYAADLDAVLGKHNIDKGPGIDYSNPRLTGKTYSVPRTDLPESYYETLRQATNEHIELAPVINEILTTAINDIEADH